MEFILVITVFLVLSIIALGLYCIKKGISGKGAKKYSASISSVFSAC